MSFSDWTKKRKQTQQQQGAAGEVTPAGRGAQATAPSAAAPNIARDDKPNSFSEWTRKSKGVTAWRDEEVGFNSWLEQMNRFSGKAGNEYQSRTGDTYQSAEDITKYRDDTYRSLDALSKRGQDYKTYFTAYKSMYDELYGEEATQQILSALTEGDSYLKDLRGGVDSVYNYWSQFKDENDYNTYQRGKEYAALAEKPDFAEKSQYKSTANGQEKFNAWSGTYSNSGFDDIAYDYINRNEEARSRQMLSDIQSNASLLGLDNSERGEMTDDEIAIFNYLYAQDTANGDTEHSNAYAYIDYLTKDLNYRQRAKAEEEWATYAKEHPVGSSAFSVLESPLKGISYLGQFADYTADGKIDQNEGYNKFSYINSAIRNEVNTIVEDKWGGVGSFAYQTGMSMGDFLLNTAITGGNQALSLAIMGTGAAADATISAKDRGLSDNQAFALGTIAGAAEIITEKVSLDALLDKTSLTKNAMGYFLKNTLAEGSEEVGSDIINLVADVLISKDKSEWQQSINAYQSEGMDENEAFWHAVRDQAESMGLDFLGGAVSGGVMSGAGIAINAGLNEYGARRTGAEFQAMGDDVVQATIQEGLASDPSTQSYKLAVQLQQKLDAGQTLTNAEIGRLYQANVQAIDAEDGSGDLQLRAADEVARKGRVTNSTATDILDNPSVMNTLAQEAGLSVTEDMSKAQQRKAVKTAVEGLARARETAAGETVTTATSQQEKATETAQVRPAAQQVHDIKRMQQAASALGENGAKALNTVYDGNAASDSFYAGFVAYYEAGVSGMDMSKVRSEYSAQLNQAQKFAAYVAGQNDAEVSLARERRAAQYAKVAGTDSGLVFDNYVASSVDTATADRVNSIAKALGVRVRFVDSVRGGTANAQVSGSDILVEKNNTNPVMFLLGHEWTHRMQELAPDQYRAFRDAVAEEAQGEARVLLDQYRRAGENISYEAALDEAAANYAGRMIEDGKVLDDFIEKHRDNRTLLEKVRDAIRSIIAKLTGAERRQAQTAEGKLTAALEAAAKQAGTLQAGVDGDTMGATRNSLKEDLQNGRAWKETREDFKRRSAAEGYSVYEGKTAAYGYRNVRGRSAQGNARQVQEEVKKLGIDAEIIDGQLLWNRNGITGTREVQQAVTVERARIFINNAATISPRNIAGHEAFHLWRSGTGRDAYIETVEDNLLFTSEAFREYQSTVAEAYLGGEADLSDPKQEAILTEELFAYISGDIHEGVYDDFLRPMFRDFDAVKAAWNELVAANASTTRFSMKKGLDAYLADLDAVTAEIAEANKQDIFAVFNESGNDGMIAFMKKKDALAAKKRRIERKIAELTAPEIESADPVDSKAFKLWFGDWSSGKGSKVVDADGKPLVVYHGTGTTIEEFLPEFTGQGNDQYGSGFYFTTDKSTADGYTTRTLNEQDKPGGTDNPNVIPVYLNIRHPLVVDATKTSNLYSIDVSPVMASRIISRMPDIMDPENSVLGDYFDEYWERGPKNYMISQLAREYEWTLGSLATDIFRDYPTEYRQAVRDVLGYDGVQINFKNGEKHFVAWFPNQIKHATENSGAFSKKDNRIKYSLKTDSQGRTLTEQQREYFKDSKVVDGQGRLKVMYHLSGAGNITIFQSGNSAGLIYFSADRNNAKRASRASSTTYECYLNIANPVNTEKTPLQWYDAEDSLRVAKWKRAGHDGVYVRDESGVSVAVFSPEQIKSVTNENPTGDPDIRYSLKPVPPVRPKSKDWRPGATFDEVKAAHPTLFALDADEADTRNPTQISGTVKSYRKIYDALKSEGFDGTILDASSGLGYGTRAGREEYGFQVDDIEPFPDEKYKPMFTDYSTLEKTYDVIINNAVLNVMPQDLRDALVVKMGEMLKPGGRAFINVRGTDVKNASSKVAINDDLMEYFISNTGSYQKGFTQRELVAYLKDALGDGFSVEPTKKFGGVSAIVTRDLASYSIKGSETARETAKLREENDLLRERVEYWRGQTRRTKRVTTDKKAVTRAARELIRSYGADLETTDISGELQSLYDYIASGYDGADELTYTEARRRAEDIAQTLVSNAVAVDSDMYDAYSDLRDYLRTTKIIYGKEYHGDIADYGDFRKRQFGRLNLGSEGHTNIDQVYQELSSRWPEFFSEQEQTHPTDQLLHIVEVLDGISEINEYNPFSRYMDQAVTGAANEIMETFFDLPQTRKTFADRQALKLENAKAKGREQVQKVREQNAARLAELREQNRQRVQNAIAKEREARERQMGALKDRYAAKDAAGRERRAARELRAKITRHASALSQKLLRPSDQHHIPEAMRGSVAAMLESINQESQYTLDENGKRVKDGSGTPTKRTEAFRALKEQYAKIVAEGGDMVIDPSLLGSDADGIKGGFDAVIAMKDTKLADMSVAQLQTVWQVVKAVEHSVNTAGKVLSKAKYARTADWAQAISIGTSSRRAKNSLTRNHALIDLETPYTFFSHYGEAGKAVYRMLRDAQDQQQLMVDHVAEEVRKIVDPKTVKKLETTTQTFTTERGEKLTLSTAQVMELYELVKRKQAHDHLLKGGVVQPEIKTSQIRRGTDSIRLTEGDLVNITGTLTPEQVKIADGLQGLTRGVLADYGNKASMEAYGYKKFTESDYWPIKSAKEGLHSNIEKGGNNTRSIKNIGMAKTTMPHASNALDLAGIFTTFANHASDMTDYASWLCAMEDINRLFNYQFRDEEGNPTGKTIKGLLDRVGGPGSQKYWHNLMEDIQNGINAPGDSPMWDIAGKTIGGFKGAAVGANIRVVIQQPTAFFRAAAVLDPQDMARGLARGVTRGSGWKKALQYSPIAMRKDAGGFDISSPYQMTETLFDNRTNVRKLNDALSAPAGAADAVTWGKLWNACEWATAREHQGITKGSEAFYRQTAKLFAEVIDQTQVVDGVLQRSNIMRSSNAVVKQATSFMGEPIMSLNLLMRAYDQVRYEQNSQKRGKAIKAMGRAATALVVTNVVNALAQSLIDAMRDDDEDKKYWERFRAAFTGISGDEETPWEKAWNAIMEGNVGSNMNPLGQIPFVKDALSIMQGYDVSRTEMEIVSDLIQAGQTAIQSADGQGKRTRSYALKGLLAAGAKMFGIPASNLTRDMWGLARSAAVETGNIPLQYEMEKAIYNISNTGNKSRYYAILYRALEQGDMDTYQHIRDDLMNSMGVDGASIDSAMRSRYNKAVEKDPDYTLPQRARDLIGSRDKYAPAKEKEVTFGADDLGSSAYQAYSDQRANDYRSMADDLTSSPIFQGMDDETRDKVLKAAYDLADKSALADHSDGQYEVSTKWMAQADDAEAQGIEPWEYVLFHTAYNEMEGTKDADGKTVKGEAKSDHVREWLEDFSSLTDEQRAFLWGTVYTSEW